MPLSGTQRRAGRTIDSRVFAEHHPALLEELTHWKPEKIAKPPCASRKRLGGLTTMRVYTIYTSGATILAFICVIAQIQATRHIHELQKITNPTDIPQPIVRSVGLLGETCLDPAINTNARIDTCLPEEYYGHPASLFLPKGAALPHMAEASTFILSKSQGSDLAIQWCRENCSGWALSLSKSVFTWQDPQIYASILDLVFRVGKLQASGFREFIRRSNSLILILGIVSAFVRWQPSIIHIKKVCAYINGLLEVPLTEGTKRVHWTCVSILCYYLQCSVIAI